jgi:hypothetical protein
LHHPCLLMPFWCCCYVLQFHLFSHLTPLSPLKNNSSARSVISLLVTCPPIDPHTHPYAPT